MSAFEIKIEGYENLMAALKKLSKEKIDEIDAEFEAAAYDIQVAAKSKAPNDEGGLSNAITVDAKGRLSYQVSAQKSYAPHVEFGTRGRAVIPAELQDIAAQYKGGQATGVSAKEAIYAWAKRNGIPEERWYLVYRSIMTNGIRPHPFFFSSFFEVKPQLVERIKNILIS